MLHTEVCLRVLRLVPFKSQIRFKNLSGNNVIYVAYRLYYTIYDVEVVTYTLVKRNLVNVETSVKVRCRSIT